MKIAIHRCSGSFSDRWIEYCKKNSIDYKEVNCYDSDIIKKLKHFNGLMWHWNHGNYRDQNFARQFIISIEKKGIKVFPNFNTCWHFDDKVGQKYLLEAIDAPLVPSYVFYNAKEALKWIESTIFPKVFKLRGGAGSLNVRLVKTKKCAKRLVRKAFNKGFPLVDATSGIKQRFWVLKRDRNFRAVIHFAKGIVRLFMPDEAANLLPHQKGYVYFQDFIPNNEYDDRIVIIGDRAIAIRRYNRKDDFRASGSGLIEYQPALFNKETIRLAFEVSDKIGSQSTAYDFVYDKNGSAFIIEISYAFVMGHSYDKCPGYWDKNLKWHEDNVDPQRYIIEDFISELQARDE